MPNVEHYHIESSQRAPDVRNHSRRDYGNRVGIWRVMDVLAKYGMRGTVAMNGEIATHYPRILEEMIKLDWELMGHGTNNSTMQTGMSEADETAFILDTRRAIEACGGATRAFITRMIGR